MENKTVNKYQDSEKRKWNRSQAKNNAAVILATGSWTFDNLKDHTKKLIKILEDAYNEYDEEQK